MSNNQLKAVYEHLGSVNLQTWKVATGYIVCEELHWKSTNTTIQRAMDLYRFLLDHY